VLFFPCVILSVIFGVHIVDEAKKLIEVAIDETGTLTNPNIDEVYGIGFVLFPADSRAEIETRLSEAGLASIHTRLIRDPEEKRRIAHRLSGCQLENLGLSAGAVMRVGTDFVNSVANPETYDQFINSPERAVQIIDQSLSIFQSIEPL
jgi:hypothetical protein